MGQDYQRFYRERAEEYDRLVQAEDCDGALGPALAGIIALDGAEVLEIGVGTGRITRSLVAAGARVVGCEPSEAMLAVARRHLGDAATLVAEPVQTFEFPPRPFDLALAGWVFGHFVSWYPETWRDEIGAALDRMLDSLVPSGTLVVIDTLGTGVAEAAAPRPELAEYHRWLERDRGLQRRVLRTDYAFPDVATAAEVTGAFFGDELAARVRREAWSRVPEHTGLWWRRR